MPEATVAGDGGERNRFRSLTHSNFYPCSSKYPQGTLANRERSPSLERSAPVCLRPSKVKGQKRRSQRSPSFTHTYTYTFTHARAHTLSQTHTHSRGSRTESSIDAALCPFACQPCPTRSFFQLLRCCTISVNKFSDPEQPLLNKTISLLPTS